MSTDLTDLLMSWLDGYEDKPVFILFKNGDKIPCSPRVDADGSVLLVPEEYPDADYKTAMDRAEAAESQVARLVEALNLMLQAFDPTHPGACRQDCFDTMPGHGYEMQDYAKEQARDALAAVRRNKQ